MSPDPREVYFGQVSRGSPGSARSWQLEYDLYYVRMRRVWHPPTDVYETESHLVVKVEIAGMDDKGLDISYADRQLSISGVRRDRAAQRSGSQTQDERTRESEAKVTYHNMEIHYGAFRTEIQIHIPVDTSAIEATYEDGFLYVTLPKQKERRVQISPRQTG
ncbi:MAG: Hsp20/alpha crystallin family protein [Chloroflexi bacterium]|nr:Hsp20/alpha crystallin family protein [Chloroflexota bacterium]